MGNSSYHGRIIKLGDIDITVKVSLRAKHIKIRISSIVELILPKRASFNKAYDFLLTRELWIRNKIRNLPPIETQRPKTFSILGQEYELVLNDRNINVPIKIIDNSLVVSYVIADDKVNNIVTSYLKKISKKEIEKYAFLKANELKVKYNRISIKDTISRWGSCSSGGNISFSWRLILAPKYVMEYVVVHELCHLVEMNHSHRFWKLVSELYPEYIAAKTWLKKHGKTLHRPF